MQKLTPALNELAARGVFSWKIEDSQTASGKKLVFVAPVKREETSQDGDELRQKAIRQLTGYAKDLYQREGEQHPSVEAAIQDKLILIKRTRA
jgi:hypothetical protein